MFYNINLNIFEFDNLECDSGYTNNSEVDR